MAITRTVTTRAIVSIESTETIDPGTGAAPTVKVHRFAYDKTFLSGNGTSQFDRVYSEQASASSALDFSNAVLDAGGTALGATKVTILAAQCLGNASTDVMRVGEDAASVPIFNLPASYATLGPGGLFLAINPVGWAITASTADIVDVNHTTGTWDHKSLIVGRT